MADKPKTREELCKQLEQLQFEMDRVALEIVRTPPSYEDAAQA